MTSTKTDSPERPLTHAQFAQQAAYLASRAASWAGEVLTLPESHGEPMREYSLHRFTAMLRETADMIDRFDGRADLAPAVRPDIQGSHLVAALRQEGYMVPYPIMLKAMQAAALEPAPAPAPGVERLLLAAYDALGSALDALQDYADTHPTYQEIADARAALAAYEEGQK